MAHCKIFIAFPRKSIDVKHRLIVLKGQNKKKIRKKKSGSQAISPKLKEKAH